MRFSVFLARYRRLLAIGLLSLLLHLLAVIWIDARLTPPALVVGNPALAVRLAHAAPAPPLPELVPAPSVEAAPTQPAAPAQPAAIDSPPAAGGGAEAPVRMPGTYRVTPPPSGRITYTLSGASTASASLAWHSDGNRYRIELDGVLGQLSSEGRIDDAGIAPERALRTVGAGQLTTRFDRAAGSIVTEPAGSAYPIMPGSQDAASLLLQLAGMGLGDARQVDQELEFWVGGMDGAGIERYRVIGAERIETGAGPQDTVHLARVDPPGSPLLELWLAPQHAWMPVKLQLTARDGAVYTQTAAAIAIDAVAPSE